MLGSAMLDVAVGMVFVYLLLSLICSAFNELLETKLKNRAADLEKGIKGLLGENTGLVERLYNHGLIFSLYRGTYTEASQKKTLPSYIPSSDFAKAVTGILVSDNTPFSLASVQTSISAIANPQVKSALTTLFNEANGDFQKFQTGLESWFNSAMDRVSGWYKRRAHVIIFSLAFLIAVAMNVNSISLAQDLWTNQAAREALVGAAQGYYDKHSASSQPNSPTTPSSLDQGLSADIEALKNTYLPIGWTHPLFNRLKGAPLLWLGALLGWFLTACAASLGAPFWFDLLGKIIVVRSSIKPGEKSAPAASKS